MTVSKKLKRIQFEKAASLDKEEMSNRQRNPARGKQGKKKKSREIDSVEWINYNTTDIYEIIALTKHRDAKVRVKALRELCPCHVQTVVPEFWDAILARVDDESLPVRKQALHNLCDGSPPHLELEICAAIETYNKEPDRDTRRIAHKVLANYHRTGEWNIL
eukprot:Awhi_evm1s3838